jgi:acetyltransferase-like isoleucine patch superfamily enzyme
LGEASGTYDRPLLLVGPDGRLEVGEYTILNGCVLECSRQIRIGSHCLISWGAVLTDTWPARAGIVARTRALMKSARHPERWMVPAEDPRPVVVENDVWVGFHAVVLPGVTIGRGAVIGSRSVIREDVPPYAIVAGNPARVIRRLEPDDNEVARQRAIRECTRTADG